MGIVNTIPIFPSLLKGGKSRVCGWGGFIKKTAGHREHGGAQSTQSNNIKSLRNLCDLSVYLVPFVS